MNDPVANTCCPPDIFEYVVDSDEPAEACSAPAECVDEDE